MSTGSRRKVAIVVQARMGSTRLPGKSMLPLAGEPLLGRLLERLKRCKLSSTLVLAIPSSPENDCLETLADTWGAICVRGSESDVMGRYIRSLHAVDADIIVRFPGDNPVPEPTEIDRIIDHHLSRSIPGFSTNICSVFGSGYPDGIGAEVFDASLLLEASQRSPSASQLEHVHLNFFDYDTELPTDAEWCPVTTIECRQAIRFPNIRLDVNTEDDYRLISALYEALYLNNPDFTIEDTIEWLGSSMGNYLRRDKTEPHCRKE